VVKDNGLAFGGHN